MRCLISSSAIKILHFSLICITSIIILSLMLKTRHLIATWMWARCFTWFSFFMWFVQTAVAMSEEKIATCERQWCYKWMKINHFLFVGTVAHFVQLCNSFFRRSIPGAEIANCKKYQVKYILGIFNCRFFNLRRPLRFWSAHFVIASSYDN